MGTAINPDDIKRFEVTEVYSHPDAKVDIVLVHGLNGHPRNTWTAKNGIFWPSQLLPVSLKSVQARVLVYGYNADVATFGSTKGNGPSSDMIHQHAQTLLANLSLERKSEERTEVPIIWVAHSLGGILVKRALELSHDLSGKNADDLRSIYVSSYGIIFLGTPHNGADPAKWGLILQSMVNALIPKKLMESHSQLIKTLQSNNETLQNINLKFLDIYPNHLQVCMVHESHTTDLKVGKIIIVDQLSAAPLLPDVTYFGIEATHSDMCKFESKNSPGWTNVSVTLKSWIQEAEPNVSRYWNEEKMARRQKDESEMDKLKSKYQPLSELTPQPTTSAVHTPDPGNSVDNSTIIVRPIADFQPSQPPSPIDNTADDSGEDASYFIKPSGFRPNSIFIGREAELHDLHRMLFDKRRRAEGTSAVLIQSIPGGGKTHLARQYVYEHKQDFPGGIFWLRAKSQAELASGFWDIARKATLKHLMGTDDAESLNDPQQFIRKVRKWLNHRHDWLMVLDGMHFADPDAMRRFIPDSKHTSLIYTSTERSVVGDHHFMNPQIMRLPMLSAREAQRLLLLELDKKEPFSKDDLKYSMELVQSMGFLPVVIHAVAQRMKTTGEPLSRFAKSYSNEPRLRGLGTYIAVVEQLKEMGASEALNLIFILCFFSQHIPVEMISLGLRALDVPVKALDPVIGRHLNNTFKILNMFALMDRNERDEQPVDSSQTTQSSKSSRDMLAENLDVIRLHGVVQDFFRDTLAAGGDVAIWLNRAVQLFCCSYDLANEKIMKKQNAGLVEDYRVYDIHGIRLREHLAKYAGKHVSREHKTILLEAQDMLWTRLEAIKTEIDRRTPESSHVIAGGKEDVFQTSIFDRTSSSSDTGPETPGFYDKLASGVSTWGIEHDKSQHESPSDLTHDTDFLRRINTVYKSAFPIPEDIGYESDREDESVAMTVQPSQRTIQQEHPSVRGWEVVGPRRPRAEQTLIHRTVKNLEKSRYRDRAGAYRAMSAVDPRLSTDVAQGFLHNNSESPRERSRGRMSGQSSAEVALNHISKTSPPPARGGGMIQDRRPSSQRPFSSGRIMTGVSSYAAPVSSAVADVSGIGDSARPIMEPLSSASSLERPPSSAMASLQRFPIKVTKNPPNPVPSTQRPPYPQSPYLLLGSQEGVLQIPGNYSQENTSLGLEPVPSNVYPRMEGLPPMEMHRSHVSLPLYLDHDVADMRHGSLPSSMLLTNPRDRHHDPLSLSSPNIQVSRQDSDISPYYPGRPEFSQTAGGYSSQPMSRDPSGQSNHSNNSAHSTGLLERRRIPSVTETEPMPQLPIFSPRVAPTSYQVYERMRERDLLGDREMVFSSLQLETMRREKESRLSSVQRSPKLEFARAALIESERQRHDFENIPALSQPRTRNWDPTVPVFAPSQGNFTLSPPIPRDPANSMMSGTFSGPSTASGSAMQTNYPSPMPGALQYHHTTPVSASFNSAPTPSSFMTTYSFPSPLPPQNTPGSPYAGSAVHSSPQSDPAASISRHDQTQPRFAYPGDGERMERSESVGSGSGGFKVGSGRKVIEFGDYPEPVDYELARERVLKSWSEREREVAERRRRLDMRNRPVSSGKDEEEEEEERVGLGIGLGLDMDR